MKTAISVPDETFERATQRASDLGMSRSAFFSRAAEHYLEELDRESLTKRINEAIDFIGQDAMREASEDAVAVSHRRLAEIDDDW